MDFSKAMKSTALLIGGIGLGMAATQVSANTAADATIRNTVTVNYQDTAGTAQTAITAQNDIRVNLVAASPSITVPANQTTTAGNAANFTYTITSTANGVDTYLLAIPGANIVESAGINSSTATTAANIVLGASTVATATTITAAGNTSITVPSDLVGADGSVNGLAVNDKVVINGGVFVVAGITDNGGVGTSTITVTGNGTATVVALGDLIAEQGTFTVAVTPGTVTGPGNQTIAVTVNVTGSAGQVQVGPVTTTVSVAQLTVNKYVQNTTANFACTGTPVNLNTGLGAGAINYCTNADVVTASPGDTMEYLIEVKNAAGAANAQAVVASDPISQFTTYTAGSIAVDPGTAVWAAALDGANDGDAAEYDTGAGIVYCYLGAGGTDGAAAGVFGDGTGGSLAAAKTTYCAFRVTVQ